MSQTAQLVRMLFPKTEGNWYQSFGNDKAKSCLPAASKLEEEAPCEPSIHGKGDHGLSAHEQSSKFAHKAPLKENKTIRTSVVSSF